MKRALMMLVVPLLTLAPSFLMIVVFLVESARTTSCGPAEFDVGHVPGHLTATTADGASVRLDREQLAHAATIIQVGTRTDRVGRGGVTVALMAALTESSLRMLANSTAYPDSASHPNDGDGSDHDSLGLFQMRPGAGWGSVAELMDATYQAQAFFGGPTGPNGGSPRGLLDVPGWEHLPKGVAAQSVEVSAYPDRYAAFEPVAQAILDALTVPSPSSNAGSPTNTATPPETTGLAFPLPDGTWTRTSGYGMRVNPVTGVLRLHAGVDFAAPSGTPVIAMADGVVDYAGPEPTAGNLVVLTHTIDGQPVATAYAHLLDGSLTIAPGDIVTAGQQIATVGSTGNSTGPHLHLELRPGGPDAPGIDPEPFFARHQFANLAADDVGAAPACTMGVPR
jgi:hypothetical protein